METHKLLQQLLDFARQRPGFEYCDYGDITSYRQDYRIAYRHLQHATELHHLASTLPGDSPRLLKLLDGSGRLSLCKDGSLGYCPGQYYPTEFRAAVCRVLTSYIWGVVRDTLTSQTGPDIRAHLKPRVSRGVYNAWFK